MKANYSTFVVVNPTAGSNAVSGVWREVIRKLRAKLPHVDFAITERAEHATDITRQALRDGWEQIVSIGGDGTNNEVLNGFFHPLNDRKVVFQDDFLDYSEPLQPPTPINPDAVLGLIPCGTGGDFRRSLNISRILDTNIERLLGRRVKTIDVGEIAYIDHDDQISSRLFLNIAGGGFSGRVVELANQTWKEIGRGITFKLVATIGWITWSNPTLQLRIEGQDSPPSKIFNLAVANGQFFGGGMHMAKGASLNDGLFDVVECGDFNRLDSIKLMYHVFNAGHFKMKKVSRVQSKRVQVKSLDPNRKVLIDVDGEDLGRFPATFTIHPLMINLKV